MAAANTMPHGGGQKFAVFSLLCFFRHFDAKFSCDQGDACITCFHMPVKRICFLDLVTCKSSCSKKPRYFQHTGTRNEHGTESRKNIIYRIRAKAHNPHVVVTGSSDHLDRGQWGEWIDPQKEFDAFTNPIDMDAVGEWQDPFDLSKHHLCNPWEVWSGMREVVAENRAKEASGGVSSRL